MAVNKKQVEEDKKEREKKNEFNKKIAIQMPDFDKKPAQIKLNSAAIMREGVILKKKQDVEEKRLKDMVMNQRDEGEFDRWKKEMDEKEDIERVEHI